MNGERFDVQGRICGVPYDFRVPTWRKIASRLYAPGAPMLVPKVWGCGWTFNLANRGGQLLLAALLATAVVAVLFG